MIAFVRSVAGSSLSSRHTDDARAASVLLHLDRLEDQSRWRIGALACRFRFLFLQFGLGCRRADRRRPNDANQPVAKKRLELIERHTRFAVSNVAEEAAGRDQRVDDVIGKIEQ